MGKMQFEWVSYRSPTRSEAKVQIAAIVGYYRGLGLKPPYMELYFQPADSTYHVRIYGILPANDVAIRRITGTVKRTLDRCQPIEVET